MRKRPVTIGLAFLSGLIFTVSFGCSSNNNDAAIPRGSNLVSNSSHSSQTVPFAERYAADGLRPVWGGLHNHTGFSNDFKGEVAYPDFAYNAAFDRGFDFFAVTDHDQVGQTADLTQEEWEDIKRAALKANKDGVFVALWGWEWSSFYGHICVLNSFEFTSSVTANHLDDFYKWLQGHPEAIAQFNHPKKNESDPEWERWHDFRYGELGPQTNTVLSLLEMGNGRDGLVPTENYENEDNLALSKGWLLGFTAAGDEHRTTWGSIPLRTGTWVKELTRENILDALRNRRTFATWDPTLYAYIKAGDKWMGQEVSWQPAIHLETGGGTSDTRPEQMIVKAELLLDGKPFAPEMEITETSTFVRDLDIVIPKGKHYVYMRVKQRDGDVAYSSPIWITP